MNESELQNFYNYPFFSGDSKIFSVKAPVNNNNGSVREINGCGFFQKISNLSTSINSEELLINFYFN